jgi:Xaa-Pro aminopeptidase
VPAHLPHDAAVYLERAGFTVTSTAAVRRARVEKTDGELAAMRRVQRAGDDALARVRAVLRTASVSTDTGTNGDGGADGGALTWRGTPVTAERLRRVANVSVAAAGVDPAGATTVRVGGVGVGPGTDTARVDPDRAARAGDPIVVDLAPRGPAGYRGGVARTAVVVGRGGWERRAHVAVEAARRAALSTVEPGVTAATVRRELAAELTAYGFQAESRATVHGVGLSPRERPRAGAGMGEELRAGTTLAIAASVADPPSGPANDRNDGDHDRTGEGPLVRLRDVVAVTSDGAELLVDPPTGLSP